MPDTNASATHLVRVQKSRLRVCKEIFVAQLGDCSLAGMGAGVREVRRLEKIQAQVDAECVIQKASGDV